MGIRESLIGPLKVLSYYISVLNVTYPLDGLFNGGCVSFNLRSDEFAHYGRLEGLHPFPARQLIATLLCSFNYFGIWIRDYRESPAVLALIIVVG